MTTKEFEVQYALGSLSWDDIKRLAYDKRTSKKVLTILSKDEDSYIRYFVAINPNTSKEVLKILSKDEYWSVRWGAAVNPNTPISVLKILSTDEDEHVKNDAAKTIKGKIK